MEWISILIFCLFVLIIILPIINAVRIHNISRRLDAFANIPRSKGRAVQKIQQIEPQNVSFSSTKKPRKSLFETINWERELLQRILPITGILAVLFGVAFFLKYAFENQWLGPEMRVILGILAGLSLLGIGHYFFIKNKYSVFRTILESGGLGLLYLSIYSAYGFYELISSLFAFVFLIFISVTAGIFASIRNQAVFAVLTVVGGFLAPLLMASPNDPGIFLLVYILVLNVGILSFLKQSKWQYIELLCLIGSMILTTSWYDIHGRHYDIMKNVLPLVYVTAIFVLFTLFAALRHVAHKHKPSKSQIAALVITPLFTFIFAFQILQKATVNLSGSYSILLAAIYLLLARIHHRRNPETPFMFVLFSILALSFLTISIPIQFDGQAVTLCWAAEGAALAWISIKYKISNMLYWVTGALTFSGFHYLVIDLAEVSGKDVTPFLNMRFFSLLLILTTIYFVTAALKKIRTDLDFSIHSSSLILFFVFNFLAIIGVSGEILHLKHVIDGHQMRLELPPILITIYLTIYGIGLGAIGYYSQNKLTKITAFIVLIVASIKMFLVDLSKVFILYRFIVALAFGILILTASYIYNRFENVKNERSKHADV